MRAGFAAVLSYGMPQLRVNVRRPMQCGRVWRAQPETSVINQMVVQSVGEPRHSQKGKAIAANVVVWLTHDYRRDLQVSHPLPRDPIALTVEREVHLNRSQRLFRLKDPKGRIAYTFSGDPSPIRKCFATAATDRRFLVTKPGNGEGYGNEIPRLNLDLRL